MLPDAALGYRNVLPQRLCICHSGVPQNRIGEVRLQVFVRHSIPFVRLSRAAGHTPSSTSPLSIIQSVMPCGISANAESLREAADKRPIVCAIPAIDRQWHRCPAKLEAAIVCVREATHPDKGGTTMQMNHRFGAAPAASTSPRLVAAAATLALVATLIVLLNPPVIHAAGTNGPVVSTAKTSLGRILVNSRGRTLYLFEKDRKGKSACAGKCATFWPPLIATGKPRAAGAAKSSLVGTTKRADGRLQVTYNHHPLYTFAKDTKKGQTNGEGVNAFGAGWDVVSPAGAKIEKQAPSTGGGGYGP
jgi:predicted lipoprotein with Yx(FWY)xxD motif